ncbi:unnamed protein product [Spodoptera exigua]|nr:unnamed protein product [Spodoptera exigua]
MAPLNQCPGMSLTRLEARVRTRWFKEARRWLGTATITARAGPAPAPRLTPRFCREPAASLCTFADSRVSSGATVIDWALLRLNKKFWKTETSSETAVVVLCDMIIDTLQA